jgi:hypothetical protein
MPNPSIMKPVYIISSILFQLFLVGLPAAAQTHMKLNAEYGPYTIGMRDTIIFDFNQKFTHGTYDGPKPFFIKIWHPSRQISQNPSLQFRDFFPTGITGAVQPIADSLKQIFTNEMIEYAICRTLTDEENPSFGATQKQLLEDMMNSTTSTNKKLAMLPGKLPCIVYLHGGGGFNFDNFLFCEYMASHGFIVISSNYNWPAPKYKPTAGTDKNIYRRLTTNLDRIAAFTKSLHHVDLGKVYGVGHSWGAQTLILFDSLATKPFKKMFLLHTTLEEKSEQFIAKNWPELSGLLKNPNNHLSTPCIVFAPKHPEPTFSIFLRNKNTHYTYIHTETPMSHDGFISLGNFRHFFSRKYQLSETGLLKQQFDSYNEVTIYIKNEILNTHRDNYKRLKDETANYVK